MYDNRISKEELGNLDMPTLVQRMDNCLQSPSWERRGNDIMQLTTSKIYSSVVVQEFPKEFQRKVIHKAFQFLLQLLYTHLAISAKFFHSSNDLEPAKQIYAAARKQWAIVSSRIVFEYFMHLTYMLGTGKELKSNGSKINKYKNWLKEKDNPYKYFAVSAAKGKKYDREKRTPEVHAETKLARQVLCMSASDIDNDILHLYNIMINQWGYILDIVNNRKPNGWTICRVADNDKAWYEIWESGDQEAIGKEIDKLFPKKDVINDR